MTLYYEIALSNYATLSQQPDNKRRILHVIVFFVMFFLCFHVFHSYFVFPVLYCDFVSYFFIYLYYLIVKTCENKIYYIHHKIVFTILILVERVVMIFIVKYVSDGNSLFEFNK